MFGRQELGESRLPRVDPAADALPGDGLDLAVRHSEGLEVILYWSRSSGRTWIDVFQFETGKRLLVETVPATVLDAFYDSFAYLLSRAA
jgi:hypothetical protein